MAHDEFEVAIEQRLHGALDSVSAHTLDEHLRGCVDCRAYEARARREDGGRRAMLQQVSGDVDLGLVEARARQVLAREKRARWLRPLVYLAAMGGLSLALWTKPNHEAALFSLALALVGTPLIAYGTRRAQRRTVAAVAQGPLAVQRAGIEQRIRGLKVQAALLLGFVLPVSLLCLFFATMASWARVANVFSCVMCLVVIVLGRRELGRLRRERDELA